MDELAGLVTQQKFRANELRTFMAYIGEFSNIALLTVSGDPPDDYLLSFNLLSLVPKEGGVKGGRGHRIQLHLPVDYPEDPPDVRALTPIFHPAVDPATGAIDVSEMWKSAPTLTAVADYLARLLTGEVYKLPNPSNPAAVAVYNRIAAKLPLDAPARAEEDEGAVVDEDGNEVDEEYAGQIRVIRRLLKCDQLFIAERELSSLPADLWFPERGEVETRTKAARKEAERLAEAIRDLAEIRELIRQNRIYELAGRMAGIAPDLWFPEREDIEAGIQEAKEQCDRLFKQAELFEAQGAWAKALGCAQEVLRHIPDHPDAKVLIDYLEQAIAISERGGDPRKTLVNPLARGLQRGPAQALAEEEDGAGPSGGGKNLFAALNSPMARLALGVAAAILLVGGGALAYKDHTVLSRAEDGFERAMTEMRGKRFIAAQETLERARAGVTGLTVLSFRKGDVVGKIDAVLNSEDLQEGVIREERVQAMETEILNTIQRVGLRLDERVAKDVSWMRESLSPVLVDAQRAFEKGRRQDAYRLYQRALDLRSGIAEELRNALADFWAQHERARDMANPSPNPPPAAPEQ